MRGGRTGLAGAGVFCAGLWLGGALAVAQGEAPSRLPGLPLPGRALVREGERDDVLGPTGRRLASRSLLEVPGLSGSLVYGFAERDLRDPIALSILKGNQRIVLRRERSRWYPSHSELTWCGGGVELRERKYITGDDSAVVDFELRSVEGEELRELLLVLAGAETRLRERLHSKQHPVSLLGSIAGVGEEPLSGVAPGRLEHDGILFDLGESASSGCALGLRPAAGGGTLALPLGEPNSAIRQLHLLVVGEGLERPRITIALDGGGRDPLPWPASPARPRRDERREWLPIRVPGVETLAWHVAYQPPPGQFFTAVELQAGEEGAPLLLAATIEEPPKTGRLPVLLGALETPREHAHLCLAGTGFAAGQAPELDGEGPGERALLRHVALVPGESLSFRAFFATGPRVLPVLARALDGVREPNLFERHLGAYRGWYARELPGFSCSNPEFERLWAGWSFALRSRLFELERPELSLPVFHDGLSAGQGPEVLRETLPRVLRELRWLGDVRYAQGQARAFMIRQRAAGGLPDRLPEPRDWGSEWRLPEALVDVFQVHRSSTFLRESWPLLESAARARLARAPEDWREATLARAELPALARGRRVLGDAAEAAALEDLREETAELGPVVQLPAEEDDLGSLDAMIRRVGGLRPRDDARIELRPRCEGLEHFAFEGIPYAGRRLDIFWDHPDGRCVRDSVPEGYSLRVNGRLAFHAQELVDVLLDP